MEKHGTAVVTYVFIESVYVSLGVTSPFGQYGMILITSGSNMEDKAYNSKLDNFRTHTASLEARKVHGSAKTKLTPLSLEAPASTAGPMETDQTPPPPPRFNPRIDPASSMDEDKDKDEDKVDSPSQKTA